MTTTQEIIMILAVVLGTVFTRFFSFIVFPANKKPPAYVRYLGTVLPYAAMSLLVVYCLRAVPFSELHGVPELISIILIILIHSWKKSMLLSIVSGTVCYMALVQLVF